MKYVSWWGSCVPRSPTDILHTTSRILPRPVPTWALRWWQSLAAVLVRVSWVTRARVFRNTRLTSVDTYNHADKHRHVYTTLYHHHNM